MAPPSRVQEISTGLSRAGLTCPERVWPDHNFRGQQVMLVDAKTQEAWLWNPNLTQAELQPTPFSSLKDHPEFFAPYSFSSWKGFPTMTVSIAESSHSTFGGGPLGLAIHEGFHRYTQAIQGWPATYSSQRGQIYPAQAEPRYHRSMLLTALRAAYTDPTHREKHLQEAAYWQLLFTKDPDEAVRPWQGIISEGTARYVEVVSMAIARQGCAASEAELRAEILASLDFYIMDLPIADREDYDLGLLSCLLLREQKFPNWEERVKQGMSPLHLLLQNSLPRPSIEDGSKWNRIRGAIDEQNTRFSGAISSMVANAASDEYTRVSIAANAMCGAYTAGGGFVTAQREFPASTIVLGMGARFCLGEGQSSAMDIQINGLDALFQDKNPCGPAQVVFLVPKKSVKGGAEGRYTLNAQGLSGVGPGSTQEPTQGASWTCVGK